MIPVLIPDRVTKSHLTGTIKGLILVWLLRSNAAKLHRNAFCTLKQVTAMATATAGQLDAH
jgi:hypothetical protein